MNHDLIIFDSNGYQKNKLFYANGKLNLQSLKEALTIIMKYASTLEEEKKEEEKNEEHNDSK